MEQIVPFAFEPLMTEEELSEREVTISNGKQAFIAVGRALQEINERRGYRFRYSTFEEYVEKRWGFTVRSGYYLMEAADTAENVKPVSQIGYSQAVAIRSLNPEQQREFVQEHNLDEMTKREVEKAVSEWKQRAEQAEREAKKAKEELAATEADAASIIERDRKLREENERLKREKNPEPQIVQVEVESPELMRKNQEMNTKIAQLSGEMETIRRDYERRLRDVKDGDVKSNRRELNRLLAEQLKAISWNHSSALFVYQRIAGDADATRAVRQFIQDYEEAIRSQLEDWHNTISIQGGDATWETI